MGGVAVQHGQAQLCALLALLVRHVDVVEVQPRPLLWVLITLQLGQESRLAGLFVS